MNPDVSVVILTWNDDPALVTAAIDSALSSIDVLVELIVIDNGSVRPASVQANPTVTLVRLPENVGVAAGRNRGAQLASAPLVCFLDSDARLEPDALKILAAEILADPRVGLSAPVFADQLPESSAGAAPTLLTKVRRGLNLVDTYGTTERKGASWDVDFAIGACQLFRRAAFDDVRGLDERYFYGPEDVDFCLRLRERGWRIRQVPGAVVHHPPRRRFRAVLSRRGFAHLCAVLRHHWRHRRFAHRMAGRTT